MSEVDSRSHLLRYLMPDGVAAELPATRLVKNFR
jgi:hypothetical protein